MVAIGFADSRVRSRERRRPVRAHRIGDVVVSADHLIDDGSAAGGHAPEVERAVAHADARRGFDLASARVLSRDCRR